MIVTTDLVVIALAIQTAVLCQTPERCAMASSGGKEEKYDCKVNICQVETANKNLHEEAQDHQLNIFLNLRGICLFCEAPQDN